MLNWKRLPQDMCPLKMGKRELEVPSVVQADRRRHFGIIGLSKLGVHISVPEWYGKSEGIYLAMPAKIL